MEHRPRLDVHPSRSAQAGRRNASTQKQRQANVGGHCGESGEVSDESKVIKAMEEARDQMREFVAHKKRTTEPTGVAIIAWTLSMIWFLSMLMAVAFLLGRFLPR